LEQIGKRVANHPMQVNIPQTYPLVPMDFALMVQVVVNVLENAVKYSQTNSPIEITADLADGKARLQIADRGVGIPADDLTRVFDKFYRVQRPESVTGTGLGLSISKGIVDIHHGTICANVREGGGTVITVELPLREEETANG
jgi:two-component system, OmpR family, sensor histidine kinase KdpD